MTALPFCFATVLMDPPTTLFAGAVLALISLKLIRASPEKEVTRTGLYALAFSASYGIAVGYMYFVFPDWMFAYLKDAKEVPLLPTYLVFFGSLLACGWAGAVGTAHLIARGRTGFAVALLVGTLFVLVSPQYLQASQYAVAGDHAAYVAGRAPSLFDAPGAKFGMTLATLGTAVPAVVILVLRVREILGAAKRA